VGGGGVGVSGQLLRGVLESGMLFGSPKDVYLDSE
jgi:hypothetical protein